MLEADFPCVKKRPSTLSVREGAAATLPLLFNFFRHLTLVNTQHAASTDSRKACARE
jgi:hypothetical protein